MKGELVLRVPKAALMTSDCLISEDHKLSAALDKYPLLSSTLVSLFCVCVCACFVRKIKERVSILIDAVARFRNTLSFELKGFKINILFPLK